MGLWDGGEQARADAAAALPPCVLVPATDVPAGLMSRGVSGVVKKALAAGVAVRSTYAKALVPGVRRKAGDEFREITVMRESVAVRLRGPGGIAFLVYTRDDGGDWSCDARRVWLRDGRMMTFGMTRSKETPIDAYLIDEALHDLAA